MRIIDLFKLELPFHVKRSATRLTNISITLLTVTHCTAMAPQRPPHTVTLIGIVCFIYKFPVIIPNAN